MEVIVGSVEDAPPAAACPYPGLRPFSERESQLFFGREQEIARVATMLEDHQLVVVHGASGCGKSSVVRAGVVPLFRMDAMANSRDGRVAIIRPGDPGGPVLALARKLDAELPRTGGGGAEALLGSSWSTVLAASPDWRADIAAAADEAGVALCLIVDQFEEIFVAAQGCYLAESARLIQFLVSLGEVAPEGTGLGERSLSVVVTMRSDYLGGCAAWDGFAEAVNRCQYLLPRLSTYGALRSIHEPARRAGGDIADRVADRLLAVIAREVDGLPILQHALMRAWRQAPTKAGRKLVDLKVLASVGDADHALSNHANEVTAGLVAVDPELDLVIDWIFRSLSDVDTNKRIIRRSISLCQLSAETGANLLAVRRIVEAFSRPEHSLVSPFPPDPLEDESIVTVGHEALLRQWTRISDLTYVEGRPDGLVFREFQDGLIWRSLAVQAEEFTRDPANVLGAAATEQRLPWYRDIAKRPGWITRHVVAGGSGRIDVQAQWDQVAAFMTASEKSLVRERYRDRTVRRRIIILFTLLLLLASYIFWQIVQQRDLKLASAKSELTIQNRISTANAQASKYCFARSRGTYDGTCLANRANYYFQMLSRNSVLRNSPEVLLPQSKFQEQSGIGPVPERENK